VRLLRAAAISSHLAEERPGLGPGASRRRRAPGPAAHRPPGEGHRRDRRERQHASGGRGHRPRGCRSPRRPL